MAGQTINDRLLAARHSLAGQGLAKSVCKATTEEMIGPKKKHLDCKLIFSPFFLFVNPVAPVCSTVCVCESAKKTASRNNIKERRRTIIAKVEKEREKRERNVSLKILLSV